jgi:hypothetical protein
VSFLLRRNLPLAWAGWFDDFTTYSVGTIVQPWVHLGDGTAADFNSSGQLHIPNNYLTVNAGGESYEFEPFTPNWGFEMECLFPVTGLASQSFSAYLTDSWAKIGATFQNCVGIRLIHAPVAGGELVQVIEFADAMSVNTALAAWSSPVTYNGTTLNLRVWVDDDQWIRVWLNNTYLGSVLITDATYKFGDTRRCVRFLDAALCDVLVNSIDHYDRPTNFPSSKNLWTSTYTDDFSASSGWTAFGTDASITGGEFQMTGTTAGSNGILRDAGFAGNKTRIRATVGSVAPNNTAGSSLILRSLSDGSQAIVATVYSGTVTISQMTGSLASPTWVTFYTRSSGIAIASGDVLDFYVYEDFAWLEQNGTRIAYASYVANTVPKSNSWVGMFVSRSGSTNSSSWTDVQIFSGI